MRIREADQDTIAAICTPLGEGGVGIIRLSGPKAIEIADKVFRSSRGRKVSDQKSHTAQHGMIHRQNEEAVDEVLLLLMRAPKSYTREDVVEIQAHGGSVVLREVLDCVIRQGARLAGKGEFTKRAFLNGRMDLLQAEAVLDLIEAKTERAARWAQSQLEGVFSEKMRWMKGALIEIATHLEASIDFPEDEIQPDDYRQIGDKMRAVTVEIERLLTTARAGILSKRGLKVVIWGRPNTGKSSLLNAFARQARAIVTPIPGTTRDLIEEEVEIEGYPFRFIDTAGVQETQDPIEKEGVSRSRQAVLGADLILFVLDSSQPMAAADTSLLTEVRSIPKMILLNKSDLSARLSIEEVRRVAGDTPVLKTSCMGEPGISSLEKELCQFVTQGRADISEEVVVSNVRQKDALLKAKEALLRAIQSSENYSSPELIASDVRGAIHEIGVLTGEIVVEDILENLFSRFCIGK